MYIYSIYLCIEDHLYKLKFVKISYAILDNRGYRYGVNK